MYIYGYGLVEGIDMEREVDVGVAEFEGDERRNTDVWVEIMTGEIGSSIVIKEKDRGVGV